MGQFDHFFDVVISKSRSGNIDQKCSDTAAFQGIDHFR